MISEETRKKMSQSHMGDKNSSKREDVRKKISLANKGKKKPPRSEEHKRKIILALKGKSHPTPWRIGKKHSEETKRKMREKRALQVFTLEDRKKMSLAQRGKICLKSRGEKHHNWKGGITTENVKIRKSVESKAWRNNVFKKNNFTDQKTGIKGGNLIAHHIFNFAEYPELRFDINNGITLSKESHKEFHKIYGRKKNTKEQLEEFLGRKI